MARENVDEGIGLKLWAAVCLEDFSKTKLGYRTQAKAHKFAHKQVEDWIVVPDEVFLNAEDIKELLFTAGILEAK